MIWVGLWYAIFLPVLKVRVGKLHIIESALGAYKGRANNSYPFPCAKREKKTTPQRWPKAGFFFRPLSCALRMHGNPKDYNIGLRPLLQPCCSKLNKLLKKEKLCLTEWLNLLNFMKKISVIPKTFWRIFIIKKVAIQFRNFAWKDGFLESTQDNLLLIFQIYFIPVLIRTPLL